MFSIQLEALIGAFNENLNLTRVILWTYEVDTTTFWISDVLLSTVLYQLIISQALNSEPAETDSNKVPRISE